MRTISYIVAENNDEQGHFFWLVEQETLHIVGGREEVNYLDVPGIYDTAEEAREAANKLILA